MLKLAGHCSRLADNLLGLIECGRIHLPVTDNNSFVYHGAKSGSGGIVAGIVITLGLLGIGAWAGNKMYLNLKKA
jgi:hypothetical protein